MIFMQILKNNDPHKESSLVNKKGSITNWVIDPFLVESVSKFMNVMLFRLPRGFRNIIGNSME